MLGAGFAVRNCLMVLFIFTFFPLHEETKVTLAIIPTIFLWEARYFFNFTLFLH